MSGPPSLPNLASDTGAGLRKHRLVRPDVSSQGWRQEMVALQKEFEIFKKGRSFKTSVGAP